MTQVIRNISKYTAAAVLLFFAGLTGHASAQNGGFAGAFSRMGFGPRGMAMGNAMTAVTTEGIYAHYNPAVAGLRRRGSQYDLSTSIMSFDRTMHSLNAAFALPPSAGLNISLIKAGVSDIDGRTVSGYHTDYFSTSEYQLMSAFGLRASEKLSLGIGLKLNVADLHSDVPNASGVGVDLGALYAASPKLNIGLAVQDLFASYNWNTSNLYGTNSSQNITNKFPTRFKAGASYLFMDKLTLSTELELRVQQSDITRSSSVSGPGTPGVSSTDKTVYTNSEQWRLGASYAAHQRLTLRAGWQMEDISDGSSGHLSAGFSVNLPFDRLSPSIDYAFVREPYGLANMHVFAIRLNL